MSFSPYASYKDSGAPWLGAVPGHWDVERIRFRAKLNPGISNELQAEDLVSFLPMEAIGDDGLLELTQLRHAGEVSSGYTYFENGDVTIAKITPCYENGKGAVMQGMHGGAGFGTTELIVMRPRTDVVPKWLYYLTMCWVFRSPGEAMMLGAGGQKRVPDLFVKDYRAAFPPADEQQAIADYLDTETARIDALIREKEGLVRLLREYRQSEISTVLLEGLDREPFRSSGTLWLGDIPQSWTLCRLKHAISAIEQGWSPECENRLADADEWGVLKAGACNHGVFSEIEHKAFPKSLDPLLAIEVRAGDVLMSRASGSADLVGSVAYVEQVRPQLMLSDKMFRLVPEDHVNARYLAWSLNTIAHRRQILNCIRGSSGLARNITSVDIKQLWLALPPLETQHLLVTAAIKIANEVDELIEHAKAEITLLKELRAATIADAVLGRVDVRTTCAL